MADLVKVKWEGAPEGWALIEPQDAIARGLEIIDEKPPEAVKTAVKK